MLFHTLKDDMTKARISRDKLKTDLLGCLIGESSKVDKVPSDEKVIGTIRKFLKGVNETLKFNMVTAGRPVDVYQPAIDKCRAEKHILESYIPTMMTEDEIRSRIGEYIEYIKQNWKTPTNVGEIMSYMKQEYAGKYDGKIVSQIAKDFVDKK